MNSARDAFADALASLPLPYTCEEHGQYDGLPISPSIADHSSRDSTIPNVETNPVMGPPALTSLSTRSRRLSLSKRPCSKMEDVANCSFGSPEFKDYVSSEIQEGSRKDLACIAGLAADDHLPLDDSDLDDELLPKPLFIQKRVSVLDSGTTKRSTPNDVRQRKPAMARNTTTAGVNFEMSTSHEDSLISTDTKGNLERHISSRSLARYKKSLATFRTRLVRHGAYVDELIAQAIFLHQEHKNKQNQRLASYWSFKPAIKNGAVEESKAKDRRERVEFLKQMGWNVTKERHGWKGEDYYADLRQQVELDLSETYERLRTT